MFTSPFWETTLCSASFLALAGGAISTTLFTQGTSACVTTARSNLITVTLAAGTLSLLAFQGVCPVAHSISLSIALESCALNMGSPNGFLTGLVLAGAVPLPAPPLDGPPLPALPLPCSGRLGNVAAGNLHPLIGTLQCTDVDLTIGQSFRADKK